MTTTLRSLLCSVSLLLVLAAVLPAAQSQPASASASRIGVEQRDDPSTVPLGGGDSDGDGVPDGSDNCPTVPNCDRIRPDFRGKAEMA